MVTSQLLGVIDQHDGLAEEFVRLSAAPYCALGGDTDWVWRDVEPGETEPVEMRQPGGLIGEFCLRRRRHGLAISGADSECLRV